LSAQFVGIAEKLVSRRNMTKAWWLNFFALEENMRILLPSRAHGEPNFAFTPQVRFLSQQYPALGTGSANEHFLLVVLKRSPLLTIKAGQPAAARCSCKERYMSLIFNAKSPAAPTAFNQQVSTVPVHGSMDIYVRP
jgi:hypothetical protein